MITSELKLSTYGQCKGHIKTNQRCNVKCDDCLEEYSSTYMNLLSRRLTYKKDLCRSCKQLKQYENGIRQSGWKTYNKKQIGKTFDSRFGEEKAKEIKAKFSENSTGDKNVNFGGKYSRGFADRPLSGPWELRYGKEKSDKMKIVQSINSSGENNPMYGKPSPKKAGNGISGRYKGIYFRSLLELSYMIKLNSENIKFLSCEAVGKRFNYELNGIKRTYHPDFYLPITDEFIEIKPSTMLRNLEVNIKANAVIEMGEKFTFVTEKDIIKIKKEDLIKMIETNLVSIDASKRWRVEC